MTKLEVTLPALAQLRERIDRQQLEAGDYLICGALVDKLIARHEARQNRLLAKLRSEGGDRENASGDDDGCAVPETAGHGAEQAPPDSSLTPETSSPEKPSPEKPSPETPRRKGHGRNGAKAFVNAEHVTHALQAGVLGALCDACEIGRLSRYREKVIIHVVGQPLFAAEVHHFEQGRCRNCGKIIRAEGSQIVLNAGVGSGYVVYDWSACAMLVVMHYFAGAPFKRLESLHAGWGVPFADTNQWNIVDQADDLLAPLYRCLERHAAQHATSMRIDDTGSMVIALARQIRAEIIALESIGEPTKDVRTGINATGAFFETDAGRVILFFTGRHHAGEVFEQLLSLRPSSTFPKLVKVTDGASKTFDHSHASLVEEGTCNAHAFLKFRAIKDKYPDEYAIAAETYKGVFDNDDIAAARNLSPDERRLFHHEHSRPLMLRLKAMCEQKVKSRLLEPSSALWEPVAFIINQWSRLTRFYEVPGVPLDSNLVEQALVIPVRYLAGSFNYQTETGAEVGDRMMSLVATARANGLEPVAYLTACLREHAAVAKTPEDFLPWNFRRRQEDPSTRRLPSPRQTLPS